MFDLIMSKNFRLGIIVFLSTFLLISCASEDDEVDKNGTDISSPIIALNGESIITLVQGTAYVEAGASATDDVDGDINVITTGTVDVNTPDTYTITYTASDNSNNTSSVTRTVVIVILDTTSPVITLNGESIITLVQGTAYVEAGATASDDVDGNINVVISGTVDVNTANSYAIIYTATDSSNNIGTATRTVTVNDIVAPDTTPPVITLNGESSITLVQGTTYVEAGASATDDVDGDVNVIITGTVNINTPNTYIITYTATDSENNTSTATRTVIITVTPDTTPPVITLNGASTVTLVQGTAYVEAGANATDDVDGTVSVTIMGTADVNTVGSHTITYTATDSSNNTGEIARTVIIESGDQAIFYDDFEYVVTRDSSDSAANHTAFLNAGWNGAKAINLTGSHNGYLYTVDSIPGYTGSFPGRGTSNRVLAIEGLSGTFQGQTDFYLQFGDISNSDENVPGDVWYQFWIYTNDSGNQRSRFSNRDKLIYPCRGQYSCNVHNNYLLYAGSGDNAPYWTDSLGGPGATAERYFVLHGNGASPPQMSVPNESYAKLGHNLDTYHLMPNQWQLVKLHFDTSGSQGTFEVWIKPMGGEFIKVAEWISGQNGFTWDVLLPGGHKMFRMPTTLPGANNTEFYDSWVYMDDFALAASENALPQYP